MTYSKLNSLICDALECADAESFALECGGALPDSVDDKEAYPLLEKIFNFAHDLNFAHIRKLCGYTQKRFSETYSIPLRTVEAWCTGDRTPPRYVLLFIFLDVLTSLKAETC